MEELIQTPYGMVRLRVLEALQSSLDYAELLKTVDAIDRFSIQKGKKVTLSKWRNSRKPQPTRSNGSYSLAEDPAFANFVTSYLYDAMYEETGRREISPLGNCHLIYSRACLQKQAARLSSNSGVTAKAILGGLHHEYGWADAA